jgi:hypothetical protein
MDLKKSRPLTGIYQEMKNDLSKNGEGIICTVR